MIFFKSLFPGCVALAMCGGACAESPVIEKKLASLVGEDGLSEALDVFTVDKETLYSLNGEERWAGAGFQPSVLLDHEGDIHVFFQARLDGSGDRSEKMIAHVVSCHGGMTCWGTEVINTSPRQTLAMSAVCRTASSGGNLSSVLTSRAND